MKVSLPSYTGRYTHSEMRGMDLTGTRRSWVVRAKPSAPSASSTYPSDVSARTFGAGAGGRRRTTGDGICSLNWEFSQLLCVLINLHLVGCYLTGQRCLRPRLRPGTLGWHPASTEQNGVPAPKRTSQELVFLVI